MDMPIQIIVILFIAITVGGGIVYFSQNNLANSQEGLEEILDSNELSDEDKILEVSSITTNNVYSLSNQCLDDNKQNLESGICFVLLGEIVTTCLSIFSELEGDSDFDAANFFCDINPDGNSVKLYYNAPLGRVEIT